jgi:orotate phosphoribosyltransferase
LLIDDVATTGSTIAEATKTLLKAGASRVDALVLALRTADFFQSGPNNQPMKKETDHGVDDTRPV